MKHVVGGSILSLGRLLLIAAASAIPLAEASPQNVGTSSCSACHAKQASAWRGSHHDLAMQAPGAATVLGNFANASFAKAGLTTTFAKKGDKFVIRTDGPGGKVADFEVKYVFGVTPLQQYLLEIPGGRLQAFTIAWDSRPKEQGGQRWFDLYPKEKLKAGDELHWTGRQQNWNYMCADCHSTNLTKGYDPAKDAFDTKWSELNVGCEACHGPGSDHAAWAKAGSGAKDAGKGLTVLLDERRGVSWIPDAKTGIAARSKPRPGSREIEVCAQCHARRGQFAGGYHAGRAFLDHYRPALLTEGLYEADGQQRDEVYTWGSFLQSRMHAKGVTCSDCHDPHSAKPVAPGNAVCAQCHLPAKFDDAKHHLHRAGSKGAQCASCHMPTRDYMVIDARHDHSFRVPRPDLTMKLGTPNACNDCHRDKDAKWAAAAVAKGYGANRRQDKHYAEALKAGRDRAAGADKALLETISDASVPGIARATAANDLPDVATPRPSAAYQRLPADADALVRLAAARSVALVPPRERLAMFAPLLNDPYLAVRLDAVSQLAGIPREAFAPAALMAFDRAAAEYRQAQRFNAERAEAWLNLGSLEARLGNAAEARSAYERSLKLDPAFIPARINLADLYREFNRNDEAEKVLREAVRIAPANADARHALGLTLVRLGRREAALAELERATKLAPSSARYVYVYAVALDSAGQRARAVRLLEDARRRHPGDRDIAEALEAWAAQARSTGKGR